MAGSAKTNALSKGLALAAAGAGAAIVERRHLHRIASDPRRAVLESPPRGQPLRVHSADGTALYAETFGPEDLPTLVLSHGWTEGIRYWALVIRELSNDFRIVAYDLRGHGQSAPAAAGDYSLRRFGEDLEAVLVGRKDGARPLPATRSAP